MYHMRATGASAFAHREVFVIRVVEFVPDALDRFEEAADLAVKWSIRMIFVPLPVRFPWVGPCPMFPGDAFSFEGITMGYWKPPMILICLARDEGGPD
jgi:hypothetical protein